MTTHLLIHTVSIRRATFTTGDDGAPRAQWQTHLASIGARVQPLYSRKDRGERRRLRIYVGREHNIRLTDRLVYSGDTYHIEDVRDDGAFQAIDAREVHP